MTIFLHTQADLEAALRGGAHPDRPTLAEWIRELDTVRGRSKRQAGRSAADLVLEDRRLRSAEGRPRAGG